MVLLKVDKFIPCELFPSEKKGKKKEEIEKGRRRKIS